MGGAHVKEEIKKYYELKEKLGTGSFAIVKRAVRKSDSKEFAVKVVKKAKLTQEELAVVHEEVEIMHRINHPHCVRLFEIFETSKRLYMVMELLTGGELFDRIVKKGSFSEKEASEVVRNVTDALKYLHGIGIVHRDLKPENLLFLTPEADSPIKITDFGLAKYRANNSVDMHTACGTPGYVAPEVLRGEMYTNAVDLWSLGVILYILLCGFPPFYHPRTAELYKIIKKGHYTFPDPYWTDISDSAKDLVTHLLQVDPRERFTAEQVLAHPWVKGATAKAAAFPASHTLRLKLLQARRKLKRTVRSIMAINRFAAAMDQHSAMKK
jgi:calcium/calmodulin-dependent protein kinase I